MQGEVQVNTIGPAVVYILIVLPDCSVRVPSDGVSNSVRVAVNVLVILLSLNDTVIVIVEPPLISSGIVTFKYR